MKIGEIYRSYEIIATNTFTTSGGTFTTAMGLNVGAEHPLAHFTITIKKVLKKGMEVTQADNVADFFDDWEACRTSYANTIKATVKKYTELPF